METRLTQNSIVDTRTGFISRHLFCHPERAQRLKGLSKCQSHQEADRVRITQLFPKTFFSRAGFISRHLFYSGAFGNAPLYLLKNFTVEQ